MNLSEPFIRRPVMTVVLTVSAILFGSLSYFRLPVNDLPAVDYPVIQVQVSYPGASPDTMANNIATPLERQFMQINGLELITSRNTQGNTSLTLQFSLDKDIDAAATDVQTAISQATGALPIDLPSPPTFSKTNPSDQPIMYIAMASDSMTRGQLYSYATTQVGPRISIVPGVSRVDVFGTKSAIRIKANPAAMWARGISIDDVSNAIRNATSYTGAGQFDASSGTALLRPKGQLETAEQYNELIVGASGGAPVYLRDVATARESVQDERIDMRMWARGYPVPTATAIIAVNRQAGANVVEVAEGIRKLLPVIGAELPGSIRITPVYDRSQTIVHSVRDVQVTLMIAFLLVVVVIFIFLGRATDTLIPAVALPLSLLLTFISMRLLGYSLDNLSLMALTLAIGFLVDDAIVFLENTVRRMERGERAFEATLNSAREISFTILSMTFLPPGDSSGVFGFFMGKEGSSPEQMRAIQDRVEETLHQDPNVLMNFTLTGLGQFLPSNAGISFITIKPPSERAPIQQVAGEMMGKINSNPGVLAFLRPFPVLEISTGATNQNQGQYAFALSGVSPGQVYETAGKLMAELGKYQGFMSVSSDLLNNTPNLDIDLRRDRAKIYGVSEARILNLLRNAYSQNYLYLIKKPEDQYQVILEVEDAARSKPEDLSLLQIRSDDGRNLIPLRELVTWKTSLGPQAVNHINQFTSVSIFFNLKPGVPLGDAVDYINKKSAEITPPAVRASLQGEALTFSDTVRNLTILMLLAVFVMYVILAILYESYAHPLTVLSTLPPALIGGLLTLLLFGEEASLYAFVGLFMLMGIVKKNGILIVDFARQRVEDGQTPAMAIHDASMDRFRPIIMTTMAAVIGSLPIAVGFGADGASRKPLGLVIVGGLIVSQFITLYITPVIYLYLEQFQKKVLGASSLRSGRPEGSKEQAQGSVAGD